MTKETGWVEKDFDIRMNARDITPGFARPRPEPIPNAVREAIEFIFARGKTAPHGGGTSNARPIFGIETAGII